jgi:hypothetical protein
VNGLHIHPGIAALFDFDYYLIVRHIGAGGKK